MRSEGEAAIGAQHTSEAPDTGAARIETERRWCYAPAVTENADPPRAPLSLEDVSRAVHDLTAEPTLERFLAQFLEQVRALAAPSAVLAAVRDATVEEGWRLLPALSVGSGALGAGRLVRQLVEELPEGLARPCLVRPSSPTPGVRLRENCLVPWSCEGESGVLLLRGVAATAPANLAEAIALLAAPLWGRLLGGPASRVEASVAELARLAGRLREDADRQLERLQAARPPVGEAPPVADPAEIERLSAVVESLRSEAAAAALAAERALAAAREETAAAERDAGRVKLERDELEARVRTFETETERYSSVVESLRSEAAAAALAAERALAAAREDFAAAESDAGRAKLQRDELEARVRTFETETERFSSVVESLRSEAAAAALAAERALAAAREETAAAESDVGRVKLERDELELRVRTLETALLEAEDERSRAEAVQLQAAQPGPGSGERGDLLRPALTAFRRSPFLPPSLRVALQESEAAAGLGERPEPWVRLALLDRDVAGLQGLAAELEAAGIDVKVAGHPEEIALLLKTPEGRSLDAAVCDVLAFRPDQNVAGLFRSWDRDRPGLAFYLSLARDSPPEVERAQRVPASLTKGRLQRPLARTDLLETLEPLRRRT